MDITGAQIRIRDLEPGDLDVIVEILTDPLVGRWWPDYDRERVRREMFDPQTRDDDEVWLAIELDGSTVGLIGYYEENEFEYRHAGMDLSLHPDFHDRGLGTDAVRTLARWLIDERGHHRLIIDPDAQNARAVRCYEKVGFKRVGVMRDYQSLRDGSKRDGLLMDLLAEELTAP